MDLLVVIKLTKIFRPNVVNEKYLKQKKDRDAILAEIKASRHPKKIIIAGPGTGKTYTLKEVLCCQPGGELLAMTFINKLVEEMRSEFPETIKVSTLHSFCKAHLHKIRGNFEVKPYLPKIIEHDANLLGFDYPDIDRQFQELKIGEGAEFYLRMSRYYNAVGFNDYIYQFHLEAIRDTSKIPPHQLIVIDEFQDFNPLEVKIIEYLETRANILIVGDDDQAVYSSRGSSPEFLRHFWQREDYEKFRLPYCTRCPEAVVETAKSIISKSIEKGYLKGRIDKPFECFLDEKKEKINNDFPKIITAQCSTMSVVAGFIVEEIKKINQPEIEESYSDSSPYPTVLIVGYGYLLRKIYGQICKFFPGAIYKQAEELNLDMFEGYWLLLRDRDSNLGWRIISNYILGEGIVKKSLLLIQEKNLPFVKTLEKKFVENQLGILTLIGKIQEGKSLSPEEEEFINSNCGQSMELFYEKFKPTKEETLALKEESGAEPPSVLLTTFEGCKGLSAGRVFILGMNSGDIPRDPNDIKDIEISRLIVALTRTRECCYMISDKWTFSKLRGTEEKQRSIFFDWIPENFRNEKGYLSKGSK
jgi:superfamily I DNA/RNA helicase